MAEPLSRRALLFGRVPKVARIDPLLCLSTTSFCATCVERCPVEGALKMVAGRPVVDPAACDGCGICRDLCPAPFDAVRLEPR